MTITVDELVHWDTKIRSIVDAYGLNCYPQEFEVCDHHDMIGYMAYSGMPSYYSHWSFGKTFERQKTMYDYGAAGLPYEMVINSNPCLAYLMRDNTLLLQILTIAHVYGHNDFFANNFTFTSGTQAKHTLEKFKSGAVRIAKYTEDPSIGIDRVEEVIDHAHSIQFQCSRNLAIKKLSQTEAREQAWNNSQVQRDPHWEIHPKREFVQPELDRVPLHPDEDILQFIAQYNPYLPEWKRDVLRIVDYQARYFVPQMETKIMNEGWASYWHYKILNTLELPQELHLEFLVRHNQVLRPIPGGLNPYHLGFLMWHDIERRWNEQKPEEVEGHYGQAPTGPNSTPGRKKMFEVRESDRDTSFLRRFLTVDIMRELALFQHEKRGKDRVVTKISDEQNWEEVKNTLIAQVGSGSLPVIKVEDADFGRNRTLYLKHYHDGRDLLLEYAEHTLRHVGALWEREVVLETELGGKRSIIKMSGDSIKIEKL